MCVLVVVSHCVDEQEETVSLKASVFVVVEGFGLEDFSDYIVDHLNFRVIGYDLVNEEDVLRCDVFLI